MTDYLQNVYLTRLVNLKAKIHSVNFTDAEKFKAYIDKELNFFCNGTKNQLKERKLKGFTKKIALLFTLEFLSMYLLNEISEAQIKEIINEEINRTRTNSNG